MDKQFREIFNQIHEISISPAMFILGLIETLFSHPELSTLADLKVLFFLVFISLLYIVCLTSHASQNITESNELQLLKMGS